MENAGPRRYPGKVRGSLNVRLLSVAIVALSSVACGGHAYRGSSLYQEGRYIEAAETFERTERGLTAVGAHEQAEFGLYRGLTFLRLGDLPSARDWLAYASRIERQVPGTLDGTELRLLDKGWRELDARVKAEPAPTQLISATSSAQLEKPPVTRSNGQRTLGPTRALAAP